MPVSASIFARDLPRPQTGDRVARGSGRAGMSRHRLAACLSPARQRPDPRASVSA
ncbi:hypothetical protein [Oryzomicrobium sp.]|uniref:hypothetical protein n=1 Tax=Oryzomicrobium sp. TaxID=1911578 RepID=UPI002FE27653